MKKNIGYYGDFGGMYVDDNLKKCLLEVESAFNRCIKDVNFINELQYYYKHYIGRKSPLYFAENLSKRLGGAKIYLKREDLNHTGSHKINNAIGQVLLAKRMGKKRIIAETGAGQHGVATATVCAMFDIDCTIYMGETDVKRQSLNVFKMKLLGANVVAVKSGKATLKEAVDAALADFANNSKATYYLIGSAVGPHPYPQIVREFQSVIGFECKQQIIAIENKLPNYVIACVGGGSNAIGIFHAFNNENNVNLVGVEPAGKGLNTKLHSASLSKGEVGIIHGFKCYTLKDSNGENSVGHSIAAGLDYPGVGPEHCFYKDCNRATYVSITDTEALNAFYLLSKTEGIIPALESSHAVSYACKLAPTLNADDIIVVNLSGRGDKDINQIIQLK
ncbi:tryptophan synthase subunit beta [Clostridium sp. 'deep sea']|uniref:tryptophan synthase subunit beta n=1 Tax=Clostridium sp. 'deep sea' TaxID=2779445 RepID=UPI0018969425|nr:tryptophan synthase subunit beta [Clostridium sp. 'deep sea']QOR36423.1 tryptophan synthase subunit beta [Clostridium sp. 'deep sea']